MVDASQRGDVDAVEIAAKGIETVVSSSAKTICEKYIHSPHSTEFAVLFLPTEGLFAEVVRRPGLVDALQREWHIMVAGPTTLVSLLVSLRVGFRSLAIPPVAAQRPDTPRPSCTAPFRTHNAAATNAVVQKRSMGARPVPSIGVRCLQNMNAFVTLL